jgi:putative ABC transport system permease protein|tara:strand:+ start:1937 stop:3178 length:1242 start_codon:yes stop_codon:yes gene_type:complete
MNSFFKNILIGLFSIRSNMTRVILTSTGLTIGIFTVSLVTASISSIDKEFAKSMDYYGNDKIYVGTWPWSFDFDWWKYRNRPKIEESSLEYINQYSEYVTDVSIKKNTWTRASFGNKASWVQLNGVYPSYQDMLSGTEIVNGRFFSQNEWELQRRVIIVGASVRDGFFEGKDPIGKKIRLNNVTFEIIGELKKQGMGMVPGGSLDSLVLMPSTTFERILTRWGFDELVLQTNPDNVSLAKEEVGMIMRVARKIPPGDDDNFAVNSADAYQTQFNDMKNAIAGMGFLVTGISLVVSAIGIMNVMFVSVRERTREIGLRKAMGATNFNILTQFLSEAVAIAIIGGSVGILLIRLTVFGISSFPIASFDGSTLPVSFDIILVFYTFVVCVVIGVLAGMIPARTAANLNPIDALRDE